MEHAMSTVDPAAEALQDLLGRDVLFAAGRVGQDIEEVFGNLR